MTHERLKELIRELEEELAETAAIDPATSDLLRQAGQEIQTALERSDATDSADTARERIADAIERLEDEHPAGVALLQRILDALANVGL